MAVSFDYLQIQSLVVLLKVKLKEIKLQFQGMHQRYLMFNLVLLIMIGTDMFR